MSSSGTPLSILPEKGEVSKENSEQRLLYGDTVRMENPTHLSALNTRQNEKGKICRQVDSLFER